MTIKDLIEKKLSESKIPPGLTKKQRQEVVKLTKAGWEVFGYIRQPSGTGSVILKKDGAQKTVYSYGNVEDD